VNRLIRAGGAFNTSYEFPLYYFDVHGVVLFADLSGYCSFAKAASPEECIYLTNHFFGWIQSVTAHFNIGIIDKYIGDEIMLVYASEMGIEDPLTLSLQTAKELIEKDQFGFRLKIGIAEGHFAIAEVGSKDHFGVSAIGHTINVASRCVGSIQANQIRIATQHAHKVREIFSPDEEKWQVEGPRWEELKNIGEVEVMTISSKMTGLPSFDYERIIRGVADAKRARRRSQS
jgi:class 3 adenylate cyclase